MDIIKKFLRSEEGFAAVEYAALAGALAVVSTMAVDALETVLGAIDIDLLDPKKVAPPVTK